ncbi:adenosylcobinamide-GDP ribazoletransferase [Acidiphilium sp.]|uniref:adenosylcobinamide-GDP ribazoletransferase n=1 Tax=Acidiphilium sp. TaxID=527 RepID=UPI003D03392E
MTERRRELAAAFGLLTRLPLGHRLPAPGTVDAAAGVWAYPVVGLVVGLLTGLVYAVAHGLGMAPFLAACWAMLADVLLTGGLHADGLADSADGLGGGATSARRLAIMRDSRIGSYGALALVLSTAMRIAALGSIGSSGAVLAAVLVAGALGRAAMVVVQRHSPPARSDGLAARLGAIPAGPARFGAAIAALAAIILLPFQAALIAVLLAGFGARLWALFGRSRLGGHTGDTLGAIEIITECLVLSVAASVGPAWR